MREGGDDEAGRSTIRGSSCGRRSWVGMESKPSAFWTSHRLSLCASCPCPCPCRCPSRAASRTGRLCCATRRPCRARAATSAGCAQPRPPWRQARPLRAGAGARMAPHALSCRPPSRPPQSMWPSCLLCAARLRLLSAGRGSRSCPARASGLRAKPSPALFRAAFSLRAQLCCEMLSAEACRDWFCLALCLACPACLCCAGADVRHAVRPELHPARHPALAAALRRQLHPAHHLVGCACPAPPRPASRHTWPAWAHTRGTRGRQSWQSRVPRVPRESVSLRAGRPLSGVVKQCRARACRA